MLLVQNMFGSCRSGRTGLEAPQVYRFTLKNPSLLSVPFDWRIQVGGTM